MRKFIVLFPGRCGGTWFASLLRSHPQIFMQGEVFGLICRNKTGKNNRAPVPRTEEEAAQLRQLQETFLHRGTEARTHKYFKGDPPTGTEEIAGFLLKRRQILDDAGLRAFLAEHDPALVYLYRENLLAQAVSFFGGYAARAANGSYTVRAGDRPVGAIEVDPDALLGKVAEFDEIQRDLESFIDGNRLAPHRLSYEELLADPDAAMKPVLRHLGVDPEATLSTDVRKNLSQALSDAVLNWPDVQARLAGTPYARFV